MAVHKRAHDVIYLMYVRMYMYTQNMNFCLWKHSEHLNEIKPIKDVP